MSSSVFPHAFPFDCLLHIFSHCTGVDVLQVSSACVALRSSTVHHELVWKPLCIRKFCVGKCAEYQGLVEQDFHLHWSLPYAALCSGVPRRFISGCPLRAGHPESMYPSWMTFYFCRPHRYKVYLSPLHIVPLGFVLPLIAERIGEHRVALLPGGGNASDWHLRSIMKQQMEQHKRKRRETQRYRECLWWEDPKSHSFPTDVLLNPMEVDEKRCLIAPFCKCIRNVQQRSHRSRAICSEENDDDDDDGDFDNHTSGMDAPLLNDADEHICSKSHEAFANPLLVEAWRALHRSRCKFHMSPRRDVEPEPLHIQVIARSIDGVREAERIILELWQPRRVTRAPKMVSIVAQSITYECNRRNDDDMGWIGQRSGIGWVNRARRQSRSRDENNDMSDDHATPTIIGDTSPVSEYFGEAAPFRTVLPRSHDSESGPDTNNAVVRLCKRPRRPTTSLLPHPRWDGGDDSSSSVVSPSTGGMNKKLRT